MSDLSLSAVSLLFPQQASAGAGSLIDILSGLGGTAAGTTNPVSALITAEQTHTKGVATTEAQPTNARAIKDFKAAIARAKTPAQLASDPRFLAVLLPATGLGDQAGYTALVSKALLSNLSDPKSLANTLSKTAYKTVAKTLDFAAGGLSVIQNPKVQQDIIDGFGTAQFNAAQDAVTPGLSNALAFRAKAASITSADAILGNAQLRDVVQTNLGIPPEIVYQGLPEQERAITDRLDLTKFKEPKFVENFARQYLIQKASSATASAGTDLTSLSVQAQSLVA